MGPFPADDFDQLDDLALDQLPFGVIGIGADGIVRRYNRVEATRSGLSRWRVIGRAIHEIAGAMGAHDLASRISAFAAAPTGGMRFECRLGRPGRTDRATVVLRRGGERANVYVCIA